MKKPRHQDGQLYVSANGAIRLKYWSTVISDNVESRKRKDVLVCQQDDKRTAEKRGDAWFFSPEVDVIKDALMLTANKQQIAFHAPIEHSSRSNSRTIVGFWDNVYIPWAQEQKRTSTLRSYVGIWKAHLKPHFGQATFLEYDTPAASKYLTTLVDRGLSATTISHIKFLASGIWVHAAQKGIVPQGGNPWKEAKPLKKMRQSEETGFYSLEDAVGIIYAVSSHPDWAALMGLCFYAACRPSEAVAVRWEDFRRDQTGQWFLHVSRGFVDGVIDETKTDGSKSAVPVTRQLADLMSIWNTKSGKKASGWVFPGERSSRSQRLGREDHPMDLRNLCQRKLKQAVIAAGFEWKGLYAFRRGMATYINSNVDVVAAQSMLAIRILTRLKIFMRN